jgi:hypothetical protein
MLKFELPKYNITKEYFSIQLFITVVLLYFVQIRDI